MSDLIGDRGKITAGHLARLAFVYIRQSSGQQVRCKRENQPRQYDFAAQAERWAWSRDRIVIIDEDQGRSGAIPYARSGFGRVVSAAARGEGGIVMSLELSRLARNDPDWHHLVYPAGYELSEHGELVLTSDEAVQAALGRVFQKFADLGTARQVYLWWREAGLLFPVRRLVPRVHPGVWGPVS